MSDTESVAVGVEQLLSPELARSPQPMYAALRESSPVFRLDGVGVVVCTRAGVDEVLRSPDIFSSNMSATDLKTKRPLIPLQIDPPDQRKYRKLLDPLFAPQRMKALEEPVTQLVNDLIDAFIDLDEIDFAKQFSIPFPSRVFLTMFGLPIEELPRFLAMKDGIIRPHVVVGHEIGHPETEAHQQATADSIYEYFEQILAARAGEDREDLLSHFLRVEEDGHRLTHEETLDICFLLLIAGLDTVSASLDCFFGHLATDPAARHTLVAEPERIPAVVEELLRFETPVMAVARIATEETDLGGCPISEGEHVMALLGSANVDDAEFPDADKLQWDRESNRHLAFGGGVHRCLGSHLARLELRVALREWHRRIPDYCIKPGAELNYSAGIRALDSFPMLLRAEP